MTPREQLAARFRAFLARPADLRSRSLAVLVGVALIVFALALAFIDPMVPAPARTSPVTTPSVVPPAPTRAPAPTTPVAPTVAPRDALRDAKRAARRFIRPYLAYTYGHLDAARIPAIDPTLRNTLVSQPPRVPPAVQRRRPHVDRLTLAEDSTPDLASFTTLVSDGQRDPYSVTFTARPDEHGHWRIVALD